jgi:hypothetical protein
MLIAIRLLALNSSFEQWQAMSARLLLTPMAAYCGKFRASMHNLSGLRRYSTRNDELHACLVMSVM